SGEVGVALDEVKFFYIKAPQHTEIKVDGAIGGIAPTGDKIAMSVYTERHAIPQVVVQKVVGGVLGDEVTEKREGKDGVIRSVQATLHMDYSQAKAISQWLSSQIEQLEKHVGKK